MTIIYSFLHSHNGRDIEHALTVCTQLLHLSKYNCAVYFFTFLLISSCNVNVCDLPVPTNARIILICVSPCQDNLASADPSGRAVWGLGLRTLASWDCGFEFRWGHGCLSVVSVVFCHVEDSALGWSLIQRIPTSCGVSECDGEVLIMRIILL
jgi:hypothetical protein